jgi:hypothetical protein
MDTKGVQHVFEIDHDFVSINKNIKNDFLTLWDKCVESYLDGDWVGS